MMNNNIIKKETLYLEDFDIKKLSVKFPEHKIGVKTSIVYLQIAKYNQNPSRSQEITILKKAVLNASNSKFFDSKYVSMKLEDVVVCFGKSLKFLPKTTFVQAYLFDTINDNSVNSL